MVLILVAAGVAGRSRADTAGGVDVAAVLLAVSLLGLSGGHGGGDGGEGGRHVLDGPAGHAAAKDAAGAETEGEKIVFKEQSKVQLLFCENKFSETPETPVECTPTLKLCIWNVILAHKHAANLFLVGGDV